MGELSRVGQAKNRLPYTYYLLRCKPSEFPAQNQYIIR